MCFQLFKQLFYPLETDGIKQLASTGNMVINVLRFEEINFVHRLINQLLPDSKHFSLEQQQGRSNQGNCLLTQSLHSLSA